ncbi:hypothetical protein OSB04_014329 [Centaurea solstitialis]|uniref:SKP1-like protein n=1 Tax=Centaurea solstitialis TaxID=347529 RepID=A0AA38SYH7_9ASTR|nr:hypothetical protein OSB04_014329 [Centaurea solstitialis]
MPPNLHFILFIFISVSATFVSSRQIATDPRPHIAGAATPLTKSLVFESSDGEKFDVELQTMGKVVEYCKKHVRYDGASNNVTAMDEMRAFDTEFVKVDQGTLFDLILAANHLNIKSLLDLSSQTLADMVRRKTPEEIRKMFNIKNDFTPEEEDEVRMENAWAFE